MLRVFHGFECATNKELFEQMLRQRRRNEQDGRIWSARLGDGRSEVDEFDHDDTIYLMAIDARKRVVGSVRLLSAVGPHVLAGHLGDLIPHARLAAPRIWEASRFIIACDEPNSPGSAVAITREILIGIGAIARKHGVERVAAAYDEAAAVFLRRFGFATPANDRHGQAVALSMGLWDTADLAEAAILPSMSREDASGAPVDLEAA